MVYSIFISIFALKWIQSVFQNSLVLNTLAKRIVFSSLYKFCEGMFRRETRHSHFYVTLKEEKKQTQGAHPAFALLY